MLRLIGIIGFGILNEKMKVVRIGMGYIATALYKFLKNLKNVF